LKNFGVKRPGTKKERMCGTVGHISLIPTKRRYTDENDSRQKNTFVYFLTVKGKKVEVCKKLFLSTLGVGEFTVLSWVKKKWRYSDSFGFFPLTLKSIVIQFENSLIEVVLKRGWRLQRTFLRSFPNCLLIMVELLQTNYFSRTYFDQRLSCLICTEINVQEVTLKPYQCGNSLNYSRR
jgi:hypothetical protein